MGLDFLHGIETLEDDSGSRPIQTVKSSVIGIIGTAPDADPNIFPLNEPVLLKNEPRKAAALDATGNGLGTLLDNMNLIYKQAGAMTVITRVEEGADIDATLTNVVGSASSMSGVHAFKGAQSEFGVEPRLYIAPGFTSQRPGGAKNPVMAELEGIINSARAIAIGDGPGTTDEDAVAMAGDFGSPRVYLVEPGIKLWDTEAQGYVNMPASAAVAGVISRTDQEKGFWWSPSNKEIFGIGGITRPMQFSLSDVNSQANYLNEQKIATIVNKNGYRLWGNRTTSMDPKWAFLSVRRTADMIYESIEAAMLWAMDRPFSAQLLLDIMESVQNYLNFLIARGALLGGTVWLDTELNTASTMEAGQLYIDFDIEPPAPLERLTFTAHRNNGYYEELIKKVAA